jgi:hypothetical protein
LHGEHTLSEPLISGDTSRPARGRRAHRHQPRWAPAAALKYLEGEGALKLNLHTSAYDIMGGPQTYFLKSL